MSCFAKRAVNAFFKYFIFAFAPSAYAGASASALPKGVRAGAFVWGFSDGISNQFSSTGSALSLSHSLNRQITPSEISASNSDLKTLQTVLNGLGPDHLGDSLLSAQMNSDLSAREDHWVTALLWGVTDHWSLGLIVPIIQRTVDLHYNLAVNNQSAQIHQLVGGMPGVSAGVQQVVAQGITSSTFNNAIFTQNGFDVPHSTSRKIMGDLVLDSRWLAYQGKYVSFGFNTQVQLPTSREQSSLTNLLDQELAENSWGFKPSLVSVVKTGIGNLEWSTSTTYNVRIAKQKRAAFANSSSEMLPNLNNPNQIENVDFRYGNEVSLGTGLGWSHFQEALGLGLDFVWTHKDRDSIEGTRNLDYARLTDNSDSEVRRIEASISFSSIRMFQRKVFAMPFNASFTWSRPLSGRNTPIASIGRFDVVFFF